MYTLDDIFDHKGFGVGRYWNLGYESQKPGLVSIKICRFNTIEVHTSEKGFPYHFSDRVLLMSGAVYRIPHSLLLPLCDADVCAFCHMFFKKKTIHCGPHVVQSCSQFFPYHALPLGVVPSCRGVALELHHNKRCQHLKIQAHPTFMWCLRAVSQPH